MSNPQHRSWQKHLQEALVEVQPEELQRKMETAETAIFHRFQELASTGNLDKEHVALNDALRTLRSLQVEKLHSPEISVPGKQFFTP
jgi:hypothetical protein